MECDSNLIGSTIGLFFGMGLGLYGGYLYAKRKFGIGKKPDPK